MYEEYEAKYKDDVAAMLEASQSISGPALHRSAYEIEHQINQWSHAISMDLLDAIFEFAINPKDEASHPNDMKLYDAEKDPRRFTIQLLRVCKNWRECVMQNDEFWSPLIEWVVRGGKERGMSWKKLVCVPHVYLSKFCARYTVDDMTEEEAKLYHQILRENGRGQYINKGENEWGGTMDVTQTNPFLLLQCLKYCNRTCSVNLYGTLCEDIFHAMAEYGVNLRHLELPFIRYGNEQWFRYLVQDSSKCKHTLFRISLERSYWCGDTVLMYLGQLSNLQSIEMDRLYGVSAVGLKYLFEGPNGEPRGAEMRNIHLTRGMNYYNDTVDFMKLMIKNGSKMVRMEFSECEGFTDHMLELLYDKDALPDLKELNISWTACSQGVVDTLQQKRPSLLIDFEEREW